MLMENDGFKNINKNSNKIPYFSVEREIEPESKNNLNSSIFDGNNFNNMIENLKSENNCTDKTKFTIKLNFNKKINKFSLVIKDDKLFEIAISIFNKYSIKEMILILHPNKNLSINYNFNNSNKIEIKIEFKVLKKLEEFFKENANKIKDININYNKKLLVDHGESAENLKDYLYELILYFKKPISEVKLTYQNGINPLINQQELKTNIREFFIKRKTINENKFIDKSKEEKFKNFEDELRNKLLISKNKIINNSNEITNSTIENSQISNSKNENLKTINKNNDDSFNNTLNETKTEIKKKHTKQESFLLDYLKLINYDEDLFDVFENIIVKILAEKFIFAEYGNYPYLYSYDNFKKFKDPKTIENLKNKIKENKEIRPEILERIKDDINHYYEIRKKHFENIFKLNLNNVKKDLNEINKINVNYKVNDSNNIEESLILNESTMNNTNEFSLLKISNSEFNENFNKDKNYMELIYLLFFTVKIKNLTEFDLTLNQILNDNILNCISALKLNDTVTKVSFNTNKLGDEGCWGLGRVFNFNQTILDLDLSVSMLTDDNLKILLIGLGDSEISLTKLNLSNNSNLTKNSGQFIAKIIEKSPNLKHLNINKNPIESGFNHITNTLIKLTRINKLNIKELFAMQIKLDSNSLDLFSKFISHSKCELNYLVLNENKFNNLGGKNLIRAFGKNKSLRQIILYKCEIGNNLVDDLIFMFRNNRNLNVVNLYDNKVNDPEKFLKLLSFSQSCGQNTTSKFINFSNNIYNNLDLFNTGKTNQEFLKLMSSYEQSNFINSMETFNKNPTNIINLKHFDISKNKCKLIINEAFLNIMENVDIEMLDICQNIIPEEKSEDLAKLRDIVLNRPDCFKIIY